MRWSLDAGSQLRGLKNLLGLSGCQCGAWCPLWLMKGWQIVGHMVDCGRVNRTGDNVKTLCTSMTCADSLILVNMCIATDGASLCWTLLDIGFVSKSYSLGNACVCKPVRMTHVEGLYCHACYPMSGARQGLSSEMVLQV